MVLKSSTNKSILINSDTSSVGKICNLLLEELRGKNYAPEEVFAIHLALEEAMINAVKHGNKFDPAKKVDVNYTISDEKFEITVTDQGSGFSYKNLPDPRLEENLYKPCGRGVLLMRSYMDVVEFNETGNAVHMIKYKAKH